MRVFVLSLTVAVVLSGCLAGSNVADNLGLNSNRSFESHESTRSFDGTFLLGAQDAPQVETFEVESWAEEIEALLTWSPADARVGFRLLDPSGEVAMSGWHEGPGRAYVTNTHPPEPGTWQVEVTAESGVDVQFKMSIVVRDSADPYGPIERTFTVPARNAARDLPDGARQAAYGLGPRDFAEVNLNMRPGDFFNYSWTASEDVYFNVHYHGESGTERPIEHRGDAHEGAFTADLTEVYALLWRNEGSEPVDVTVQMDGVYRLHSMTRDG